MALTRVVTRPPDSSDWVTRLHSGSRTHTWTRVGPLSAAKVRLLASRFRPNERRAVPTVLWLAAEFGEIVHRAEGAGMVAAAHSLAAGEDPAPATRQH